MIMFFQLVLVLLSLHKEVSREIWYNSGLEIRRFIELR